MDLTNAQIAKLKNYFEGNPIYEGGIFDLYPPADVQKAYKELGHSDLLEGEMYKPFENIRSYDEDPRKKGQSVYEGYTFPEVDQNIYIQGIENYGSGYGPTREAKTLHPAIANLYHVPGKIEALKKSGVDTQNLTKSFLKHNPDEELWSGPSQDERDLQIAETIGHENYHQILANNPLYALLKEKVGEVSTGKEEAFIRALETQLSKTALQRKNAVDWFTQSRPGNIVSPHLKEPVNRYLENVKPQVNEFIEIANFRNRPGTPIVPMDRGRGRDGNAGGAGLSSGMTTGQHAAFRMNNGGRVGLQEGGWHPGVGRDERGYQSTHPSYGGEGGGNNIAPVKKINISPVVETKYNRDLNLSYPSGKVGLKALTKLGKIQAMLDFKDLLEGEDLESEITYENQFGPTFVGGRFDTEGEKELGVGFNKGNLSIGAYTDLDDLNQIGLRYQKTFKDGGLATMFERRR